MKIFERFLDKFLIFAQFIHIDAIVGGYEATPHRNALIEGLLNIYGAVRQCLSSVGVSSVNRSECLKSILKSVTYSFT